MLTRWTEVDSGRHSASRCACCLMGSALVRRCGTNLVAAQIFVRVASACEPALELTLVPLANLSAADDWTSGRSGTCSRSADALAPSATCFVVRTASHVVELQHGNVVAASPREWGDALRRARGDDGVAPTLRPSELWQLTLQELATALAPHRWACPLLPPLFSL